MKYILFLLIAIVKLFIRIVCTVCATLFLLVIQILWVAWDPKGIDYITMVVYQKFIRSKNEIWHSDFFTLEGPQSQPKEDHSNSINHDWYDWDDDDDQ